VEIRIKYGKDNVGADRYFEDYIPGTVEQFGAVSVDEGDIVAFGNQFDPQPFHIDAKAAADSEFGSLIASGWHTASLTMGMLARHYFSSASSLGSPGVTELRWLQPVYPGSRLFVRVTVIEARRSRSKPDRGIVESFVQTLNQNHEVVLDLKAANFIRCRQVSAS